MTDQIQTNQTQMEKSLIEEMGLSDLPEERQAELLQKMFEVLLKRVYIEAREKLSDEDNLLFDEMIEKKAHPEEIEKFLKEKISDFEEMIKNILDEFREEMLKT